MNYVYSFWKSSACVIGGCIGWLVAEFKPTFPLIIVAIIFIFYDAWTAYMLDRRVHKVYPDKVRRRKAYFTSFAFGKVIRETLPKRIALIILAFLAQKYVLSPLIEVPLSCIVTGAIVFEQALSILENESSCREDESESRLWRMLRKILVDKTERHFDINLDDSTEREESL